MYNFVLGYPTFHYNNSDRKEFDKLTRKSYIMTYIEIVIVASMKLSIYKLSYFLFLINRNDEQIKNRLLDYK